jgi:hypothetical protein
VYQDGAYRLDILALTLAVESPDPTALIEYSRRAANLPVCRPMNINIQILSIKKPGVFPLRLYYNWK